MTKDTKSYKQPKEGDAFDNQDMLIIQRMYNHDEEFKINNDSMRL